MLYILVVTKFLIIITLRVRTSNSDLVFGSIDKQIGWLQIKHHKSTIKTCSTGGSQMICKGEVISKVYNYIN